MATECDSPCLAMPTQLRFQRSRARQEPRARYRGVKGRSAPCRHRDRRHGAHDPSRVSASPKSGRPDLGRAGWLVALACAQKHAPGTARGNDRSCRRSATQRACALATRRIPAILVMAGRPARKGLPPGASAGARPGWPDGRSRRLRCQAPPCEMVARRHRSPSRDAASRLADARPCRATFDCAVSARG